MTTIELRLTPDGLLMSAPRLKKFIDFAQSLGAKPVGDNWLFAKQHEAEVRQFCRPPKREMPSAPSPSPRMKSEIKTAAFDTSLVTLFDPSQPMSAHVQSAADLAMCLDPSSSNEKLTEASAGFESFAARLREWAARREGAAV